MKENKEFENLKSFSEKVLEEKDSILEKADKEKLINISEKISRIEK